MKYVKLIPVVALLLTSHITYAASQDAPDYKHWTSLSMEDRKKAVHGESLPESFVNAEIFMHGESLGNHMGLPMTVGFMTYLFLRDKSNFVFEEWTPAITESNQFINYNFKIKYKDSASMEIHCSLSFLYTPGDTTATLKDYVHCSNSDINISVADFFVLANQINGVRAVENKQVSNTTPNNGAKSNNDARWKKLSTKERKKLIHGEKLPDSFIEAIILPFNSFASTNAQERVTVALLVAGILDKESGFTFEMWVPVTHDKEFLGYILRVKYKDKNGADVHCILPFNYVRGDTTTSWNTAKCNDAGMNFVEFLNLWTSISEKK